MWKQLAFLLRISRSEDIIRRYFVVNGFDGALTMLGLIIGFLISPPTELSLVISVCLGAAIALGMSGISSAYVSEIAERQRSLKQLEEAMVADLGDSAHGDAARYVPILTALVNGSAPLVISILILLPLWLDQTFLAMGISPLHAAVFIAFILVFMLGVYLGTIAGASLFKSGIRTLVTALVTTGLIYLFAGHSA